ncbi:MAG TPA: RES domain-containing protein [Fluviicoccus sp.]|nr:RES domain-containing protein [Fluviicoccus sp.]
MTKKEKHAEDLEKLIYEFEGASLDLDIETLKQKLSLLLNGYTCITKRMESHYAFRARINIGSDFFEKTDELWYPPKENIQKPGRLNRINKSIFYISASHDTATLEVRPKVGDLVTILRVKLKDSARLPHVMELGIAETQSQHGLEITMPLLEQTNMKGIFLNKEEIRKNLLIRSCISRLMMKVIPGGQEDQYKKSVAIAEILMESPDIDGVLYPSIAGDGSRGGGGMNMAIKPESADELFVPDHAWVSVVENTYEEHGYIMRCVKNVLKIESGSFVWGSA